MQATAAPAMPRRRHASERRRAAAARCRQRPTAQERGSPVGRAMPERQGLLQQSACRVILQACRVIHISVAHPRESRKPIIRLEVVMARTDAIVLGAGMVGVSAAVHLAKRGLSVALVDRRSPGEETSYGNAGIIEGNTY